MGKDCSVGAKDGRREFTVDDSVNELINLVRRKAAELCKHGHGKLLIEITARHDMIVSTKVGHEETYQIGPK